MGLIFFSLLAASIFLSIPLITGLFARRMGRPFLKWFFIGILLPFIAIVIIFLLPDISTNGRLKN